MPDEKRASMATANLDGWKNELTGVGDPNRDKTLGAEFNLAILSGFEAELRWRGSDLGARIVETIPDEMTREGWQVQIQPTDKDERADDDAQEQIEAVDAKLRDLGAARVLYEALCYERAYGGAAILLGADDGETDLARPLDESRIQTIRHLTAFRGGFDGEIVAWSYQGDPRRADFGQPDVYQIRNIGVPVTGPQAPGGALATPSTSPATILYVHASRLLVFPGPQTSRWARVQMCGWGDSIFTRCDRVLSQYDQTWGGVGIMLAEFAQGVLKVEGLAEMMARDSTDQPAGGGSGLVAQRALAMQMSKSIAKALILDAKEDFSRETISLAGVPEILQQFALRLAAAAEMPVSLLLGQAPAGLNATGASDIRFFYDRIASRQRERLIPALRQLIRLCMVAADSPTGGEPERWDVVCRPLWQMSAQEEADLRNKQAMTDQVYATIGAVTPDEIAASRFGGAAYSTDTVIDIEGRRAMATPDADSDAPPLVTTAPTPTQATAPVTHEAVDPQTALNGAQVTALQGIVTSVARREIPRATGVAMISAAFPLSLEQADRIMGDVGAVFFEAPKPQPAPQSVPDAEPPTE